MAKLRVFADTNVILESFRIGCWKTLSGHYAIETVQKCVEETLTGDSSRPGRIPVSPAELKAGLACEHPVTHKELALLELEHPACTTLDEGEKHLLAWLSASKLPPSQIIVLTTADKAALWASHKIHWLDCAVSLEYLMRKAGLPRSKLDTLALQYRDNWLASIKVKIRMGILP